MFKWKTLRDGADVRMFADSRAYLPLGRFLRRTHLDEILQLYSVFRGDMALVGPRPMEEREARLLPGDIRERILSVRPGLTSLASLHFFDEEALLRGAPDKVRAYYTMVKPVKISLDCYWVEHRSMALAFYVLWATAWRICKNLLTRK